jgi:hypothetical protein
MREEIELLTVVMKKIAAIEEGNLDSQRSRTGRVGGANQGPF